MASSSALRLAKVPDSMDRRMRSVRERKNVRLWMVLRR
jgi:hypothetical protein